MQNFCGDSALHRGVRVLAFIALLQPGLLHGFERRAEYSSISSSYSQSPPEFSVASIKINNSGRPSGFINMALDEGRLIAVNMPLAKVVAYAFDFRDTEAIFGAPGWANEVRYDITAPIEPTDMPAYRALDTAHRKLMVQKLLIERCNLKAHLEMRDLPAYALIISHSGNKMVEAKPGDPKPEVRDQWGRLVDEDAIYRKPGSIRGDQVNLGALALALTETATNLGRPVVDRTGLTGKYSFSLQWSQQPVTVGTTADTGASDESVLPDIFTAIQEQLGLKLKATSAPVRVLVIEKIDRPMPN